MGKKNYRQLLISQKVLILHPKYLAGKVGIVYDEEFLLEGESQKRWLIQVDSENILVSLDLNEFLVLNHNQELV
jgi:hypothetical protein